MDRVPGSDVNADSVDVTNESAAAGWLRDEIGTRKLAGLFRRGDRVVFTPREDEQGYVKLTDEDDDEDGPAQVRPVTPDALAARIDSSYRVHKRDRRRNDGEAFESCLFPDRPVRRALSDPSLLPNLRTLKGVTHTPLVRADGSLLTAPGYDPATKLLYLPTLGLDVPPVPADPTPDDVRRAIELLNLMLSDFPFVNDHYRANYLGTFLSPLLRDLTPPPYKMHTIEAHQAGSGKTLLANLQRHVHGGVFRVKVPENDAEVRKQISAILSATTGPIIVIDNAEGTLNSGTWAGLLTNAVWDDRPLGRTDFKRWPNDRYWTFTGNNLDIGADLPRRNVSTLIDPGMPHPETRIDFAIKNIEEWVQQERGRIIHAFLTLVRRWDLDGRPLGPERTSDSYARWVRTVDGILSNVGIPGGFDHREVQREAGSEDEEWGVFLRAVHAEFGSAKWTTQELLKREHLIEEMPGPLQDKATYLVKPGAAATSVGKWLKNRNGRWVDGLCVRQVGEDHGKKLWCVQRGTELP